MLVGDGVVGESVAAAVSAARAGWVGSCENRASAAAAAVALRENGESFTEKKIEGMRERFGFGHSNAREGHLQAKPCGAKDAEDA